jgi:hypothetical protein
MNTLDTPKEILAPTIPNAPVGTDAAPAKRYRVMQGRASWHQQRAGHFWAGSMIASYTLSELTTLKANLQNRGEPFLIEEMPA